MWQSKSPRPLHSWLNLEKLESRDVPAMQLGMNLEWVQDFSPAWTFKDLFLSSRSWYSQAFNTVTRTITAGGGDVHVDERGWPTSLNTYTNEQGQQIQQQLLTMMFDSINGEYPTGAYRCEWQGEGTLQWLGDARLREQGDLADGTHYAIIDVTTTTNAGIMVRIASMNEADPIRNMHIWMPDYNGERFAGQVWRPGDGGTPYHPLFTERLEPFGALRFVHWGRTEVNDIVEWEQRRPADHARQATFAMDFQNGVSPEYMLALANQLDADPWLNMPHMVSDDYVRNLATYVRDTLEPGRKVYVEWSNEVWNFAPGFEATFWVADQVRANPGMTHEQVVARETRRDFAIWSEVFAGQSDRLVRVVGGFGANVGYTSRVVVAMNGEFDAIAIAPYIGIPEPQRTELNENTTADEVIDRLYANLPYVYSFVDNHRALLEQYEASLGRDLQLLAYEGGTHLDNRNASYRGAFFEAEASPRMYDLYREYLRGMNDRGFDLFMNFKYTDRRVPSLLNNDFGALHRMDQPLETAHKYRALVEAATGNLFIPTVSIDATSAAVVEGGRRAATFRLTRGGDWTSSLDVAYQIGGTASAVDHAGASGIVRFEAGSRTAEIVIATRDDRLREDDETLTIALTPGDGNELVRDRDTATITLQDDDRPLDQKPVLMVIANQDFYFQEYADTLAELERAGLQVEVAAATRTLCRPHFNSGQVGSDGTVMPDLTVEEADARRYSAIVFVGGWGSSTYQFAFTGTYVNPAYNGTLALEAAVNQLIVDFTAQDKYVTAICHGVGVLAWARVNGMSPIAGRTVAAYALSSPPWQENTQYPNTTRWHVESNGATMVPSRSIGDPTTADDDVIVDGRIITAENFDSARAFGQAISQRILAESRPLNTPPMDLAIAGPTLAVRGQTATFTGQFVDPDEGDTHTQSWQMIDVNGSVVWAGTGPTFDFTPLDAGSFTVRYTVADAAGESATVERAFESRVLALLADPMDANRTALYVGGSLGNDRLFFYVLPRTNDIRVVLNNQWIGAFSGVSRVVAYGQAGNDVIWAGPGGRDLLIGGDGRDALYGRWRNTRSLQEYPDFTLSAGRVREFLLGW